MLDHLSDKKTAYAIKLPICWYPNLTPPHWWICVYQWDGVFVALGQVTRHADYNYVNNLNGFFLSSVHLVTNLANYIWHTPGQDRSATMIRGLLRYYAMIITMCIEGLPWCAEICYVLCTIRIAVLISQRSNASKFLDKARFQDHLHSAASRAKQLCLHWLFD